MNNETLTLAEQFRKVQWLLHRYHHMNHGKAENPIDPRQGQGRILALLRKIPEISQKELSELLGIRQQSLGELLGKLEKNGYITRSPLETDRRAMMVHITDQGKEVRFQEFDCGNIFSCLTDSEQEFLDSCLQKIEAALEAELQNEEPSSRHRGCGSGTCMHHGEGRERCPEHLHAGMPEENPGRRARQEQRPDRGPHGCAGRRGFR